MPKYIVSAVYEFEVEAKDVDEAFDKAATQAAEGLICQFSDATSTEIEEVGE